MSPQAAGQSLPASTVRDCEQLVNLLDISALLPIAICLHHVRAVIVWGLIQPGQRGRAAFKGRYRSEENIRHDVTSKLGQRYNSRAYDHAVRFLTQQRVLLKHRNKKHGIVYSLNPHQQGAFGKKRADTPSLIGQAMVQQIVQFNRRIQREFGSS